MTVIAGPAKQPAEVVRLKVDYTYWLAGGTLAAISVSTPEPATDPELSVTTTLDAADGSVTLFFAGGAGGEDYTVVVTVSSALGEVREDEVRMLVREVV